MLLKYVILKTVYLGEEFMETKISGKNVKEFVMEVLGIKKEQLKDVTFELMTYNHAEGEYEYTDFELRDNLNIGALIGSEGYLRFEYPACISCKYVERVNNGDYSLHKDIILNQKNCTYFYEEAVYFQDHHGRMYYDGNEEKTEDLSLKLQEKFINSVKGYREALKAEIQAENDYWTSAKENNLKKIEDQYKEERAKLVTKFNEKLKQIKAEQKQLAKLEGSQPNA